MTDKPLSKALEEVATNQDIPSDVRVAVIAELAQVEREKAVRNFDKLKWKSSTPLILALVGLISVAGSLGADLLRSAFSSTNDRALKSQSFQHSLIERALPLDGSPQARIQTAELLLFWSCIDVLKTDDFSNLREIAARTAFPSNATEDPCGLLSVPVGVELQNTNLGSASEEASGQTRESPLLSAAKPLLDFVAKFESGNNPNALRGADQGDSDNLLSRLTIADVLELQSQLLKNGAVSTTAGKYQITRITLLQLSSTLSIDKDSQQFT